MRSPSVRTKLTLWNVGVLALALGLLGFLIFSGARASLLASVDKDMSARADRMAKALAENKYKPPQMDVHVKLEGVAGPSKPRLSVDFGRTGFTIALNDKGNGQYGGVYVPSAPNDLTRTSFRPRMIDRNAKSILGDPPYDRVTFEEAFKGHRNFSELTYDGEPIRVLSIPLRLDGKVVKVLQWPHPLTETYHALDGLTHTMLIAMPVILILAAIGGFFLTKRSLKPVSEITAAASAVGAESLDERLEVRGADEFSRLAQTFNGMLCRLQGAFQRMETAVDQQRRFTADASHELRTPLTVIKANTSLALKGDRTTEEYRKTLLAVNAAADSMNRLVGDLLLLARSDSGQVEIHREPVCVERLLKDAITSVTRPCIAEIQLKIGEGGSGVLGDAHALSRVFLNLLENAVRYTPKKGLISVELSREGQNCVVVVRDTGAGIDPEHLPHLTERFFRADDARDREKGGTGLGLSICDSIVRAHGGELSISSVVDQGTTVTVRLPLE